ncbi:hypothetical protein ABZ192_00280 [Streptomyces sp. NPDC006235]|uniref:hypothetical protein n=1 Tax=Streptomyces sp. NPDC006235 TaxID=3156736 RepID=UPI0033A41F54
MTGFLFDLSFLGADRSHRRVILLSPFGLLVFLGVRAVFPARAALRRMRRA